MGFINEDIKEKDYKKYYSFNLIGPYTSDVLNPWKWTIDKERDCYLIATESGRDSEHPDFYVFIYKNKVLKIETFYKIGPKTERHWNFQSILMPSSLKLEKDVVYTTMLEAFKAHGYLYRDKNQKDIYFDHLPEPSYYKD